VRGALGIGAEARAGRERLLVLGGTTEASALVRALAHHPDRFDVVLSLAGRTRAPRPEPVTMRTGGFGGPEGLAAWVVENGIDRLIDATHPFAARISRNAALAAERAGVPLLALRRPPWERVPGDLWTEVDDMAAASVALGVGPLRVFLTVGRQELAAFASAPQHAYSVRTIEPVGDVLSGLHLTEITARGPFTVEAETAFLREAEIERLVTKNSGGEATYAKIEAARDLGIPIVIVRRPSLPEVPSVPDAPAALDRLLNDPQPGTLRGV